MSSLLTPTPYLSQRPHVDSGSELRSAVDGGSSRSVTQASAKSLPAFLEHTNVALYQVRAADMPIPGRELAEASLEEANQR